jgi:hypothetical protein
MTFAFSVFSTYAVLAYFTYERLFGMSHQCAKLIHFILNTIAILIATIGTADMYYVHANAGVAHFQTLHSWFGIFIVALYWLQYVMGAVVYLFNVPLSVKKSFMMIHVFGGLVSTFGVYLVIIMGILYHNPGLSGDEFVYRTLNMAGIAMFITALCVAYIIYVSRGQKHFSATKKRDELITTHVTHSSQQDSPSFADSASNDLTRANNHKQKFDAESNEGVLIV